MIHRSRPLTPSQPLRIEGRRVNLSDTVICFQSRNHHKNQSSLVNSLLQLGLSDTQTMVSTTGFMLSTTQCLLVFQMATPITVQIMGARRHMFIFLLMRIFRILALLRDTILRSDLGDFHFSSLDKDQTCIVYTEVGLIFKS
jgi:hypothetical protein